MKHAEHDSAEMAAPVTEVIEHPTDAADHAASWVHNDALWIAVSFIICIALFARYVLPKINASLDARAAKIHDQLEQASRLRSEAQELLATYQLQQTEKLKEAEAIVAAAKRDAVEMRARAESDLKLLIERRTLQAQEKIERAEAEAVAQIRSRIVTMATDVAHETLAKQYSADADERAVERALAAIATQIH